MTRIEKLIKNEAQAWRRYQRYKDYDDICVAQRVYDMWIRAWEEKLDEQRWQDQEDGTNVEISTRG
ncbi:hypothetical protein LCGC14_2216880 [marine sediment metagenome]|uniref:Uncharacterized protein n=1 Tax=marine sediment metagenome TaxID=412755 RepID=A0A0F9DCC8_9ZZZZ